MVPFATTELSSVLLYSQGFVLKQGLRLLGARLATKQRKEKSLLLQRLRVSFLASSRLFTTPAPGNLAPSSGIPRYRYPNKT